MVRYTRLFSDEQGTARFEDVDVALDPDDPAPHELSVSEPMPATAVLFGRAPPGGSHPQQPESRRQLIVCLSGSGEITASGESRVFRAGDVLLVEDVDGVGHSSSTSEGFTVVAVVV
jgi:quercetin dioxygenase-like cupin family protein